MKYAYLLSEPAGVRRPQSALEEVFGWATPIVSGQLRDMNSKVSVTPSAREPRVVRIEIETDHTDRVEAAILHYLRLSNLLANPTV
jgi:hypothetical protein